MMADSHNDYPEFPVTITNYGTDNVSKFRHGLLCQTWNYSYHKKVFLSPILSVTVVSCVV